MESPRTCWLDRKQLLRRKECPAPTLQASSERGRGQPSGWVKGGDKGGDSALGDLGWGSGSSSLKRDDDDGPWSLRFRRPQGLPQGWPL